MAAATGDALPLLTLLLWLLVVVVVVVVAAVDLQRIWASAWLFCPTALAAKVLFLFILGQWIAQKKIMSCSPKNFCAAGVCV